MDSAQSPNHVSEAELVRQALDGHKDSYGILVQRHQNLAYRLALQKLGNFDMARDAVQEAFIVGYENLERLREPAAFASWIAGITRNICRNILRSRNHNPVSLEYLADAGIEPSDSGNPGGPDPDTIAAVRKLITRLPEKHREIIELRYTEEYSCQKIANFLNLPISTVLSRLFYARKKLQKLLMKEGLC